MFPLGRSFSQRRTYSRDSAEMFVTSASVKPWRANASGAVGMGYVGQFTSPTMSDSGTERSSISEIGSPVARSKRKSKPVFEI